MHDTRLCLAKRKVVNLRYSKVVLVSDKITSFILLTILTKNIPFIKTISQYFSQTHRTLRLKNFSVSNLRNKYLIFVEVLSKNSWEFQIDHFSTKIIIDTF